MDKKEDNNDGWYILVYQSYLYKHYYCIVYSSNKWIQAR